jgi:hypothetical protein
MCAVAATPNVQAPTASGADREAGQQVLGVNPVGRAPPPCAPSSLQVGGLGDGEARVGRLPEIVADDSEMRGGDADPVVWRAVTLMLHPQALRRRVRFQTISPR